MVSDKLKKRKQELNLTTEQLSELSGVPVGTINKILTGETRSPRYDTLNALEKILYQDTAVHSDTVRESAAYAVDYQGRYTLNDYYNLPDDVRAELIDGMLVFMEAPSFEHQEIITALLFEFELYIRSHNGPCKVLAAPLDVQLDCDSRTMVQPDIVVSCKKEQRNRRGIFGAPDLCVEVVSDSTRKRDLGIKVAKYMNAGVREYWIVDAKRECVICYRFETEDYPVLYTFQDQIPVQIYNGDLTIDFAVIRERLRT